MSTEDDEMLAAAALWAGGGGDDSDSDGGNDPSPSFPASAEAETPSAKPTPHTSSNSKKKQKKAAKKNATPDKSTEDEWLTPDSVTYSVHITQLPYDAKVREVREIFEILVAPSRQLALCMDVTLARDIQNRASEGWHSVTFLTRDRLTMPSSLIRRSSLATGV